jgi:hypothetical protein
MPAYKTQEELIDGIRKQAPSWSYSRSDEQIYNIWADEQRKAGNTVSNYVKPSISAINIKLPQKKKAVLKILMN